MLTIRHVGLDTRVVLIGVGRVWTAQKPPHEPWQAITNNPGHETCDGRRFPAVMSEVRNVAPELSRLVCATALVRGRQAGNSAIASATRRLVRENSQVSKCQETKCTLLLGEAVLFSVPEPAATALSDSGREPSLIQPLSHVCRAEAPMSWAARFFLASNLQVR